MKKLLILLLILASCSTEEDVVCEESAKFFIGLNPVECGEAGVDQFQVSEETYMQVTSTYDFCEIWLTIKDVEGNTHEGFYQYEGKHGRNYP